MERVLITGGAGFIGSTIINLIYDKYDIVVLDKFCAKIHGRDYKESFLFNRIKDKCKIVKGDVCNINDINKVIKNVDYIIHLAAETGTGQSMYEISNYTKVNIVGTSNLFQSIIDNNIKVKKIILASSRAVYGEGMYNCDKHGVVQPKQRSIENISINDFEPKCPICSGKINVIPTTENSKLMPVSYYAYTKMSQEDLVKIMCDSMNIPYTIFRYQNVYGAGQSLDNPYTGILSIFSKLLLNNKTINVFEDGKESRDFIHVYDVAKITCEALKNNKTDYKYINVGSGERKTVLEVAEILKKLYNSKSNIQISGDFRKGDIRHNVADISKLKQISNINICYDFEKGIEEFVVWVKSEYERIGDEFLNSRFDESIEEMKINGMFFER